MRERSKRVKELVGRVISDKMAKAIVVRVSSGAFHPIFKKITKRFNKFKAHDEENKAKTGDLVRIQETRPLSKDKRWRLVKIIESAR